MGAILTPALLQQRHIEATALAQHDVPGYKPQHGRYGGECAGLLHETPVLLRYALTMDGHREAAEVEEVSIAGNTIPAAYFDAETRADWGRDCMRSRGAR